LFANIITCDKYNISPQLVHHGVNKATIFKPCNQQTSPEIKDTWTEKPVETLYGTSLQSFLEMSNQIFRAFNSHAIYAAVY